MKMRGLYAVFAAKKIFFFKALLEEQVLPFVKLFRQTIK